MHFEEKKITFSNLFVLEWMKKLAGTPSKWHYLFSQLSWNDHGLKVITHNLTKFHIFHFFLSDFIQAFQRNECKYLADLKWVTSEWLRSLDSLSLEIPSREGIDRARSLRDIMSFLSRPINMICSLFQESKSTIKG